MSSSPSGRTGPPCFTDATSNAGCAIAAAANRNTQSFITNKLVLMSHGVNWRAIMRAEMFKRTALLPLLAALAAAQTSPFDQLFSPLADPAAPGFAVLVRQNGRTIFQHGYGVRDLRTRAPIDPVT